MQAPVVRNSVSVDSSSGGDPSERPSKVRRTRLACLRCQTRKIKCDGSVPKCSACRRADIECIDGRTTVQEGSITRSAAASLHDQIQRLKEALRTKCPEEDIEQILTGRNNSSPGNQSRNVAVANQRSNTTQPTQNIIAVQAVNATATSPPVIPISQRTARLSQSSEDVAHEIGLIPLSAGVSKYVGPSSGFSFAKLLFARADQASPGSSGGCTSREGQESVSTKRSRSVFTIRPTALPTTVDQAVQLSKIYFEHVHIQYPFLHEPTHYRLIHEVYRSMDDAPKVARFQVTMVLAIAAIILSKRLRIPFTGEGLCASAMKDIDQIDLQNSTQGVQCLLLISMFTLHSPYLGANPWYLNYQCLASVLDLGLQRDVPASDSVSYFEREIRTRIFWVIYSLDRTLATTLGRPIGLRDEACDLRVPAEIEDAELEKHSQKVTHIRTVNSRPGPISCAITLFQLAQMNSEIKYILHSITRNTPKYTYPQIPDIQAWQSDFWQRLQNIQKETPKFRDEDDHLLKVCQIRYHEIVMLLFRPTPGIRTPSKTSLTHCHNSAQATIKLWKELYETDRMSYSWITIHSVCLSAITLLYCIWTAPEIAATTKIDILTSIMRDASNLLSAAGEHWTEARRSRNSLDDLTAATVRWLIDAHTNRRIAESTHAARTVHPSFGLDGDFEASSPNSALQQQQHMFRSMDQSLSPGGIIELPSIDTYINWEDLAVFVGAPDPFANNFSDTMEGMFSEYQPLFDLNPPPGDMNMGSMGFGF